MLQLLIQFLVALMATVSFALLVDAPTREFLWAGVTGGIGWLVYCVCVQSGLSVPFASLFAAIALALLSRAFAVARRCPSTVFLISGIFALVPGAGVYYTAYYFIQGDSAEALARGYAALQTAIAIAVGIVLVMALPGKLFRVFKQENQPADRIQKRIDNKDGRS